MIFSVARTDDNGNNAAPFAGSLRDGINQVNAGKFDTIDFAGLGAGPSTVLVQSVALPTLVKPVTITGVGKGITLAPDVGPTKRPPDGSAGLTFGAGSDGSNVYGLKVFQFPGDGILLNNLSLVTIGSTANGGSVTVAQCGANGTAGPGSGIHITGIQAKNDVVVDCFIGTSAASTTDGNANDGVLIDHGANNNQIGGLNQGEHCTISSNANAGVEIVDSDDNKVVGCAIGTDNDISNALANKYGVYIHGSSSDNTIGAEVATTSPAGSSSRRPTSSPATATGSISRASPAAQARRSTRFWATSSASITQGSKPCRTRWTASTSSTRPRTTSGKAPPGR